MDNKLFFKESVLPVTLFCSALMFSPVGAGECGYECSTAS